MLKRFTAVKKDSTQSRDDAQDAEIEELVLRIRQLVRHRGYDRTRITSERLKRYLPSEGERNWQGESMLRQHHATARIDPGILAYLIQNARVELQMAHERLTH